MENIIEIQDYVEDWVGTYADANNIQLTKDESETISSDVVEALLEQSIESVEDINDDRLAELVNLKVESR